MQIIIPYIGTGFLIISFFSITHFFGIIDKAKSTFKSIQNAFIDLQNPDLDDEVKENTLKGHAKHLFFISIQIFFGTAIALIFPILVLRVCEWFGLLSLSSVITVAVSWQSILAASVTALLFFRANPKHKTLMRYSLLERILYRIAFLTKSSQIAIADFEEIIFAKDLKNCRLKKPIFITALPRTGTTLLLNLCSQQKEFASHTYRDMPFILIPMLWSRITASFQKAEAFQERAHGDGVLVNVDSPEAFEEMLWIAFWSKQYLSDRIIPWSSNCESDTLIDFFNFYQKHMRKIIALRQNSNNTVMRYISKNNNNIARLDLLIKLFPDATLLIPFRHPLQHAASLLRQHQNFLELHSKDGFACDYMKAIGHFDFGKNLKPIDFDGWLKNIKSLNSNTLLFWIKYWVSVYGYINTKADEKIFLLSYDELCCSPQKGLNRIAEVLDITDRDTFLKQASVIRASKSHEVNTEGIPKSVSNEANMIYFSLKEKSLV